MTQVDPQPPARGLSQSYLVQWATQLTEAGFPRELVDAIVNNLNGIANKAAFEGAGEIAVSLAMMRKQERERWELYTDSILTKLRDTLRAQRNVFGYLPADVVDRAIASAIKHVTPVNRPTQTIIEGVGQ